MSVVTATGWGWRHAGRAGWAVRGLDLRIEEGERVLLLGASGAGKSTLIQALAGVLGGDDEGEHEGALTVSAQPGLVLQDPDSQVIMSRVGDDVAFGCENLGVPREETWQRVGEALDAVGLDLPIDRSTSALSGGQKQRLALAGVIAMRPGLLLLDEPTANLDPDGVIEVRDAVGRVLDRTGATLVVIEHRVDTWWRLVDRVIVLEAGGGVVADGSPAQVLEQEGARLAASGVWVPGYAPELPDRVVRVGAELMHTESLGVGRGQPLGEPIDRALHAGSCLGITGANGSGKSTLALTLGGLIAPVTGSVVTPYGDPLKWKSRDLVSRIGSVFQDPEHQFIAATVRAELSVGDPPTVRIDELLARLRLDALVEANPFTLSGGEKRRLSVATALVARPPLLILDEPTFGQDARTWAELVSLFAELLDEGSGIAVVSHDLALVAALCDQRIAMTPVPVPAT